MAIQIRGKSNPVTAADETPTIAVPTGTVDGDLMIMIAGRSTAGGSVYDTPLGWYAIPGSIICGAHDVVAFYRVAASEPADYTLNIPDGAGAATYVGIIALYSDTASGVRFDPGQVANQYNASSANRVWPTLTFSAAGLLLNFATLGGNQASAPPGGSTEQWDVAGSAPRPYLMTEARSAGATGTRTATGTATTSKCVSVALIEGTLIPFAGPKVRSFTAPSSTTVDSSKTVTAPPNLAVGDLMLMQVIFTAVDRTPACTGWTMVNSVTGSNSVYVLRKVAVAGDLGATFTVTFASGSVVCGLGILAWFSPSGLPLVVDHTSSSDNASATDRTYAAGVPTVINTGMAGFGNIASANQTSVPDPSYMQERYDYNAGVRMHGWTELLSASGSAGARLPTGTASASRTITVIVAEGAAATITADFTGTPLTIFTGQSVAFTDASTASGTTITTRAWTFGDGGVSSAANPSRTYTTAGTYTVTLTAGNGTISNAKTRTAYVVVTNPTVTASFTGTPLAIYAGQSVAFTDASSAVGTAITTRAWTFGDGGTSTATNPTHTYAAAGTYTVTLTVSDGTYSNTQTRTAYVVVTAVSVTASFTGTPLTGTSPLTVAFTDASTAAGTTIATRSWTFGDAGTSTATNPSHVYATAGAYTVTLTVGDGTVSNTQTRTAYVVVAAPPGGLRPSKSGQDDREGLDATNLFIGLKKID